MLAVHAGGAALPTIANEPAVADEPDVAVAAEVRCWTSLWEMIRARCGARVVQHTFAVPGEIALGHLALRTGGARPTLLARVNAELGRVAGDGIGLVDCERLAADVGKRAWFDARYWHRSKQAVSFAQVPLLARHTAAVIGAQLGVSRKCLVLDLDNTLWGGVLGEEGLTGIALGDGAVGEAFAAFQDYVVELKNRGVVLAVCSKNNDAEGKEAFERHPAMRLRLGDIASFSACWDDKPTQLRRIAADLGLGLDSLVFVDDNPVEREAVRQLVGEVDVLALPADPHGYVRALADYPFFETTAFTAEDTARTATYRARAELAAAEAAAGSLAEFHRGLDMTATVVALDELTLPRVAQLVGKTNQFNLTGRRRGADEIARLAADPATVVLCVRLADRFADHGLVAVVIAVEVGDALAVDTWLMSCRVIGRTLEDEVAGLNPRADAPARARPGRRRVPTVGEERPGRRPLRTPRLHPAGRAGRSAGTGCSAGTGRSRSVCAGHHPLVPRRGRAVCDARPDARHRTGRATRRPVSPRFRPGAAAGPQDGRRGAQVMVQDRLQQIFREIFSDDDLIVADTTTAADVPGWDSLAHINLIYAVEREFSIQIADDRLASFTTVGDLREHIEELSRVH